MKHWLLLIIVVATLATAQDCEAPLVKSELPGIENELTNGFPAALEDFQERQALLKEILFKFKSSYYDLEVAQQNQEMFREEAMSAVNEHDFYSVIRKWVNTLYEKDSMSAFSSPRELAALGDDSQPFAGVGMSVNPPAGAFLTVLSLRPDGPAFEAGIRPRDRIVAVDGESCPDVANIRGEEGTKVILSIQTPGEEPRDITLTRRLFTSYSPAFSKLAFRLEAQPSIGYFFLSSLALDDTDTTDKDILKDLAQDGETLTGFILDLRQFGDGVDLTASIFLGHFTQGNRFALRDARGEDSVFRATKQDPDLSDVPLAVLTDEGTASVGVWLAAVLKERSNTVLIGQPTSPFPIAGYTDTELSDGSSFFIPSTTFVVNKGTDLKSDLRRSRTDVSPLMFWLKETVLLLPSRKTRTSQRL